MSVKIWTFEACKIDALKFKYKSEWAELSSGAYNAAKKSGWLDVCCEHMIRKPIPSKWTMEKCKEFSIKFSTRKEWQLEHNGSYKAAYKNGWLDECCAHMKEVKKPSNYWTIEICKLDALNYETRNDWNDANTGGYAAAHRNGWLEECCSHMVSMINPKGYWTLQRCQEEAKKFSSKTEWVAESAASYHAAHKNGWIDQCTSHMEWIYVPKNYWTLEKCKAEALKYTTRTQWAKEHPKSYNKAHKNDWLEECCSHMETILMPDGYWTLEKCQNEANKFTTRSEWRYESGASYSAAYKQGFLDFCCGHMKISMNSSKDEYILFNSIKELFSTAKRAKILTKNFFKDKPHIHAFELDVFIPELKKAIEYNGKYWHSEEGIRRGRPHWPDEDIKNYHSLKREFFTNLGIEYLEIAEKDWIENPEREIQKCLDFLTKSSS